MEWYHIYGAVVLGNVHVGCCTLALLAFMFAVGGFIGSYLEDSETALKWAKRALVIGVLTALIGMLTPTTNEFAAMYVIPKVAANEDMQQIPSDTAKLAKKWLQDQLNMGEEKK